jgi:hypothetical protein
VDLLDEFGNIFFFIQTWNYISMKQGGGDPTPEK